MAEAIPHPNRVRILLTDRKFGAAELTRNGDLFLNAGKPNVAVMFYERSKSKEGLARIKQVAVREGDEFLLSAVAKADPSLVDAEEWRACGEAALGKGKFVSAREAFRKAGDEDRAAQAHERFLQIFPR